MFDVRSIDTQQVQPYGIAMRQFLKTLDEGRVYPGIWGGYQIVPPLHLSKKKSRGPIGILSGVIAKRYASIQIYIFNQIVHGDIPCERTLGQYIYINKPRGRSGGVPPTPSDQPGIGPWFYT